jgi:hypothetical protein
LQYGPVAPGLQYVGSLAFEGATPTPAKTAAPPTTVSVPSRNKPRLVIDDSIAGIDWPPLSWFAKVSGLPMSGSLRQAIGIMSTILNIDG